MELLHWRDWTRHGLCPDQHVSHKLHSVHNETYCFSVCRNRSHCSCLHDLGCNQRPAHGHHHRKLSFQNGKISPLDFSGRDSKCSHHCSSFYTQTNWLGLCRFIRCGLSTLGNDLHYERHCLLGNASKSFVRSKRT